MQYDIVEKAGDRVALVYYDEVNLMFDGRGEVTQEDKIQVVLDVGSGTKEESYELCISNKTELECSKIDEFLKGKLLDIPRDVLGGIDLLLKGNSSSPFVPDNEIGAQPERRFQQSLKYTEQGLTLCMDQYSAFPTTEPLPVISFLKENVDGFKSFFDDERVKKLSQELRKEVEKKLKYLIFKATHRSSSKPFTIKGLSNQITREITVSVRKTTIRLANYYKNKYKKIIDPHLPCLDLGRKGRNYLPIEVVVVHKPLKVNSNLYEYSRAKPKERKEKICERMQSVIHGYVRADFLGKFGLEVDTTMTKVEGHIIGKPVVKAKASGTLLNNIHVVKGVSMEKWAFVVFKSSVREMLNKDEEDKYATGLKTVCKNLGIGLKEPSVKCKFDIQVLSNVSLVENMLRDVIKSADTKLEIIICMLPGKHEGYKYIKWVSETKIGVITQCCLASGPKKGERHFFRNLALKINAKLGRINVELDNPFEGFKKEHIMLVGASISHPEAPNKYSSSIAAVAANIDRAMARYATRFEPQYH
ncbi:hypothetical protein LguiB_033699 [Lonicera macranthoides]